MVLTVKTIRLPFFTKPVLFVGSISD